MTENPLSSRVANAFAQKVIIRIEETGMTYLEVAVASHIGTSTVGFIAKGHGCHFWTAIAIARTLGISLDDLMNSLLPVDDK